MCLMLTLTLCARACIGRPCAGVRGELLVDPAAASSQCTLFRGEIAGEVCGAATAAAVACSQDVTGCGVSAWRRLRESRREVVATSTDSCNASGWFGRACV